LYRRQRRRFTMQVSNQRSAQYNSLIHRLHFQERTRNENNFAPASVLHTELLMMHQFTGASLHELSALIFHFVVLS
jgi:hypothetical protein